MTQVSFPIKLSKVAITAVFLAACAVFGAQIQPAEATFPGDNGRIAFVSYRDGDAEIFTMNVDGTDVIQLTHNTVADFDPTWSPDGTKIAFARTQDGNIDIYTMNADGTDVERITYYSLLDRMPTWSPDGTNIAFVRSPDGDDSWQIFSIKVDRSEPPINLTQYWYGRNNRQPDWSPNGNLIAFDSVTRYSGSQDIYTLFPMTRAVVNNLTAHQAYDDDPSWSPDAGQIAFTSYRDGNAEIYTTRGALYIPNRLTTNPAADQLPVFSPDGTKIAFTSDRDGNKEIYIMNADGTDAERLTTEPSTDENPDWQPINVRTTTVRRTLPLYLLPSAPGLIIRNLVFPVHSLPIKAVVGDTQSNVKRDDIQLFIDGTHVMNFSYNEDTNILTYTGDGLSPGKHTMRIVAQDEDGNKTTKAWNFKLKMKR